LPPLIDSPDIPANREVRFIASAGDGICRRIAMTGPAADRPTCPRAAIAAPLGDDLSRERGADCALRGASSNALSALLSTGKGGRY
jgi:hypothetical protein